MDTNALIVAAISGLLGAAISAGFSYVVRLEAKKKEDAEERKRLAHVNFLILTESVASSIYLKNSIQQFIKQHSNTTETYDLSHAIAIVLCEQIKKMKPTDLVQICLLIKPFLRASIQGIDKFEISPSDLGRMHETAIYAYQRLSSASIGVKASIEMFDGILDAGDTSVLDASILHSMFLTYQRYLDATGILRAALKVGAGLTDDYSVLSLNRSVEATKSMVSSSFSQNAKMELAKKAAEEATASTAQ